MSCKVALAGMEVEKFFNAAMQVKAKSCLITYWSLRKNPDWLKKCKEENPDVDFIIDSGAFTFFNKEVQPVAFYAKYRDKYLKYIEKYRQYAHCFAELDIDALIGDEAKKWREEYFEPMNKKIPIVFIGHDHHTPQDWEAYCKKYQYVGLGSGIKENYQMYLATARAYLSKVHAFGFTKSTEIQSYDFYSCDSSTWLLGSKYGETDVFNGKTISRYDNKKKDVRRRFKSKFENAGLSWEKIEQEEYYEIIKMNMLAFIEMENYLKEANRTKSYWLKRLPRPSRVFKADEVRLNDMLRTRLGWPDTDIQALDHEDKKDRAALAAYLQWNEYTPIKEWCAKVTVDDVKEVFGADAVTKLSNPLKPQDGELDNMRKFFNLSLLRGKEALKRESAMDYTPCKVMKRRPDVVDLTTHPMPVDVDFDKLYYDSGT